MRGCSLTSEFCPAARSEVSVKNVVSSLWLDRNVASRQIPATGRMLPRAARRFCRDFVLGCPGGASTLRPATRQSGNLQNFIFWCALVRFSAVWCAWSARSRMEPLFTSLKSGSISRISFISGFKIISPQVGLSLKLFLVSWLPYLII